MNKKEVSMFLMAETGRVLCNWMAFHNWAQKRLGRSISRKEYGNNKLLQEQLSISITEAE